MTLPEELISRNQTSSDFSVTCPYLGTMPDPHTSVAYPSGANFCHRTDDPQLVSLTHQRQHCLIEAYDSCPTYREDTIPVASIDVAGPTKRNLNWKRPIAILAVVLFFGVVLFGAYALFFPFRAESVDASTPSIQKSGETTLAGSNEPTPTLVVELAESNELAALAEDSDAVEATPDDAVDETAGEESSSVGSSLDEPASDGVSEEAKMAPIAETPTPTALPDLEQDTLEVGIDDEIDDKDSAIEFVPESKPLPTAAAVTTEETEPTATAVPEPTSTTKIADGTAVIRTGALNVRTGPGPQFPSIALAYNGEYVILIGRNGDNSWVKVRLLNGPVGWIYAAHIETGQPLDEIPFIPRAQR